MKRQSESRIKSGGHPKYSSSRKCFPPLLLTCILSIATGQLTASDTTVRAWNSGSGLAGAGTTAVPAGIRNVKAISAGYFHSLVLRHDGTVVAWGLNTHGQATVPAGLNNVIAIAAGGEHSLALREDGTIVAWGRSNEGQTNIPVAATDVKAIAAGGYHNLAVKEDGTVVAWGRSGSAQTIIPPGLDNVKAVAASTGHSLALKEDGTVVAWGFGERGQTTVPDGLSNVIAIDAADFYSIALKDDGTYVAWGEYGGRSNSAVPATGGLDRQAVAAGTEFIILLREDGTVDGGGYFPSVPGGLSGVTAISAGQYHSLAIIPVPPDTTPPTINITGPKNGKYRSPKIQINGTAADNEALQRWEYKINSGKWTNGGALSGMSAPWKKRVGKVKAGTNVVQVRAYDSVGLVSPTAKRKVRLKR